ncbi:MAG: hypothetical protein IJ228_03950 [Succinivibrio sp.]|nr:hypothetical protein [Succinivibrio sp.]
MVTESTAAGRIRKQRRICTEQAQQIEEILDELRAAMSDGTFSDVNEGGGRWLAQTAQDINVKYINRVFTLFEEASGTSTRGEGRRPAKMINCLIRAGEALLQNDPETIPDPNSDEGKLRTLRLIYARDTLMCVLAQFAFEYTVEILKLQGRLDNPDDHDGSAGHWISESARIQHEAKPLQKMEEAPGTDHEDLPYGGRHRSGCGYRIEDGRRVSRIPDRKVTVLLGSIYETVRKLKDLCGSLFLEMPEFPEG